MREFVAKHRRIPGVKFNRGPATWPAPPNSRLNPNDLTSNGGDFISARRQLIARYALPWLLNLHHLDSGLYADILFAACLETATEKGENAHTLLSTTDGNSVVSCEFTIVVWVIHPAPDVKQMRRRSPLYH